MEILKRLAWMNTCSKKQCRSLFWRMRATMKKAVKNQTFLVAFYGGPRKQFNFQYDPLSYALNFDDTTHHYHHQHHEHDHHHYHVMEQHKITKLPLPKQPQEVSPSSSSSTSPTTTTTTTIWVYVIWVGSF